MFVLKTIEVHTPEEELTYGPPLNLHVEPLGPHSVRVSWAPPAPLAAAPDALPPDKYTLHYTEVRHHSFFLQLSPKRCHSFLF